MSLFQERQQGAQGRGLSLFATSLQTVWKREATGPALCLLRRGEGAAV